MIEAKTLCVNCKFVGVYGAIQDVRELPVGRRAIGSEPRNHFICGQQHREEMQDPVQGTHGYVGPGGKWTDMPSPLCQDINEGNCKYYEPADTEVREIPGQASDPAG